MTAVSRETLDQSACANVRRYHSPVRKKKRDTTRAMLIESALSFLAEGQWRPEAGAIAARADRDKAIINHYFGSLKLLYRVIARERPDDVLRSLGIEPLDDARTVALQRALVWIVMTGERRPLL